VVGGVLTPVCSTRAIEALGLRRFYGRLMTGAYLANMYIGNIGIWFSCKGCCNVRQHAVIGSFFEQNMASLFNEAIGPFCDHKSAN
jgi:hypothetical protein